MLYAQPRLRHAVLGIVTIINHMNKVNSKSEAWIHTELAALRTQHLERHLQVLDQSGGIFSAQGRRWINLASNDYLDLAHHPRLKTAAAEAAHTWGTGATASRLITGTLPPHITLEQQIARHKGYEAALVFGSGYMTNAGVIQALVNRHDHVFADRLVHASMIDAVRLSGARLHRFAHNDSTALHQLLERYPAPKRLVLTESVYSMDGDLAPLPELARVVARHACMWMVDEAHATGIFGPNGAGRVRAENLNDTVTLCMGTLSKALGGYGGYVACSSAMRQFLINRARALIYTTAPPPPVMAAATAAFTLLAEEPGLGPRLLENADTFRAALQTSGLPVAHSAAQIVPIHVGDNEKVVRIAARLKANGILVGAIRPPTVPVGTARLRCSLTLAHEAADIQYATRQIREAFVAEGLA
jgi:8-amino-7-oxononanoate synthase